MLHSHVDQMLTTALVENKFFFFLKKGIYTPHMECYEMNLLILGWYHSSIAISHLQTSAQ